MESKSVATVFYSWQSDLPNNTNRGFIEQALENAVKSIRSDEAIKVEPVLDRDTRNVPGSPDIAATIFEKIEQASAFVCDVSIINQGDRNRLTPNPNVLLELGYALKVLGSEKIIIICNIAFGSIKDLPFDLQTKRILAYHLLADSNEKASERKKLESILRQGLQSIFSHINSLPSITSELRPADIAIEALNSSKHNQTHLVRNYLEDVLQQIDELAPFDVVRGLPKDVEHDEIFVQALDQSENIVEEFTRVTRAVAGNSSNDSAHSIYQGFTGILNRYELPRGFGGLYEEPVFDFHKFLGHELFVTLIASLIRENRWALIAELLESNIYVENSPSGTPQLVPFYEISKFVYTLDRRNTRLDLRRVSLHADFFKERHQNGIPSAAMPFKLFVDADFFLFLRGELSKQKNDDDLAWRAWSCIYMTHPPRFLVEAYGNKNAQQLLQPLGVPDVTTLRTRLSERAPKLRLLARYPFRSNPLYTLNLDAIGTK